MNTRGLSLSISAPDWQSLRSFLFTPDEHENAAGLVCGISEHATDSRLLVRQIYPVEPNHYIERLPYHLEVSPAFYNSLVDRCIPEASVPVIVHSHPFRGPARYSPSDDYGERRLLPILGSISPRQMAASLLLSEDAINSRKYDDGQFVYYDEISVVGASSLLWSNRGFTARDDSQVFQRQILAFGVKGQTILENLRVAIIGVGGTGSLVAENLVRAGVRNFLLIDPDIVEVSNLNRLAGAIQTDIGKPKTLVISEHLRQLGASQVTTIVDSAIKQSVLMRVRDRHLVFSATDNDLSRAVLNRFAYQYLIPVIDMGIRLDARNGKMSAAAGRVSVIGPGAVCLRCSHHINPERIQAESMSVEQRTSLAKEGYVMGLDEPVPAVASLNAVVAGLAATTGINMWVSLTGGKNPADQLYDATQGVVFLARPNHETNCDVCDPLLGLQGLGDFQRVSAYD